MGDLDAWVGELTVGYPRSSVTSEANDASLEALIDELARVLHDPGEARELARRAGFSPAVLPAFDTASVFWSRVVRAAHDGRTPGGVVAIVKQAKARFPGNRFFAAYGSTTATASTPPEPGLGAAIDNSGANIGQQIVVHGHATFGAMTVSVPASAGPSQGSGSRDTRPAAESLGPPPRADDLTQRPRPFDTPVDVVIITAAEGEDTALLEVSEGALSPWTKVPSPEGYASEVYRATFESLTAPGAPIHVVTTRPPRMGVDHAGVAAGQLLGAFKPRCIAICGVCAGRPDWTTLGDVIIADRVWRYDTGERFNATPGGRPTFRKDTELFALSPTWLRTAENAKRWASWPGDGKAWLEARPRTLELQGLWLMKQLAEGLDPAEHPDVGTMCSHWTDVTAQLEKDGLVVAGALTDKGREHLAGVLFRHQKRLPEPRPWALHVAPMGTGNHLVRDVDIWASLEDTQRLVCGFDMEASTIGLAAWAVGIPFLAVKGVMDFGLPDRHRGFQPFAARASAEVLVRLLRTLVVPSSSAVENTGREGIDNLGERRQTRSQRLDEQRLPIVRELYSRIVEARLRLSPVLRPKQSVYGQDPDAVVAAMQAQQAAKEYFLIHSVLLPETTVTHVGRLLSAMESIAYVLGKPPTPDSRGARLEVAGLGYGELSQMLGNVERELRALIGTDSASGSSPGG